MVHNFDNHNNILKKIEELREKIRYHNYRYYVLDNPAIMFWIIQQFQMLNTIN